MARSATVFEILIASPADVGDERRVLRESVHDWNILQGRRRECVLEPVMWETHSTPELGERPQAIINRQLVDSCDALIGTFWTRLGSPTGEAPSGTVEEIERFSAAGKPVMLYFSSRPIDPNSVDPTQLAALRDFKNSCRSRGLLEEYDSPAELRRKLALGLDRLVDRLIATQNSQAAAPSEDGNRVDDRGSHLRQMLKQWKLSSVLRHRGHDDGKVLMGEFVHWYVTNHQTLTSSEATWDALANLAKQMTKYTFTLGGGSSERFFQIGEAVLANAVTLLETGSVSAPVDDTALDVLRCLQSAKRDQRKSAEEVAQERSMDLDTVQQAVAELKQLGLVKSQLYVNAPPAYEVTGSGLVCVAIHPANAA